MHEKKQLKAIQDELEFLSGYCELMELELIKNKLDTIIQQIKKLCKEN